MNPQTSLPGQYPYYQQPYYPGQYPSAPVPSNGGWQQPSQQPSMQPANYSNNAQPRFVVGKAVNSPDEIMATDVPMDGSIRLFPSADGTRVYRKEWDGNGRLNTHIYELHATSETSEPSFEDKVMARLDKVEALLEGREAPRRNNRRHAQEDDNADD